MEVLTGKICHCCVELLLSEGANVTIPSRPSIKGGAPAIDSWDVMEAAVVSRYQEFVLKSILNANEEK